MRLPSSKLTIASVALVLVLSIEFFFLAMGGVTFSIILAITFALSILVVIGALLYGKLKVHIDWRVQSLKQQMEHDYLQIESLCNLHSVLPLRAPLPQMRGWAISPDFAALIVSQILENKPKRIVEASSGVSTLLSAYCLERLGEGVVTALDHEAMYADITRRNLSIHRIENWARVIHAPLVEHQIHSERWKWYDLASVSDIKPIDMLIIDGPPDSIQREARYPALPLLMDRLSPHAVILIDDADREDEKSMIKKWKEAYPGMSEYRIKTEKGAVVLVRCPQSR